MCDFRPHRSTYVEKTCFIDLDRFCWIMNQFEATSVANVCCCFPKAFPVGFSWRTLDQWPVKCIIVCRAIICHALIWFGWFCIVLLLIFDPQEPRFSVTNASLTQFNFNSTSTTLHYNLALNITIRNPNRRIGMYYHRIQVSAIYRNKRFGFVNLPDSESFIYQGHKNTTFLQKVVLQGQQQLLKFGQRDISHFDKETAAGAYSISVQLSFRVKVRYGKLKANFFTPGTNNYQRIDCKLKLPLSVTNETSGSSSGFKATKCDDTGIFS